MADIEMIKLVAMRTGLGLKFISKDEKISILLSELSKVFGERIFVLKGGTAINRIYLKKRFSEDIDFDFIAREGKKEKTSTINEILKTIKGFDIERGRMMKDVIRYDCRYVNEFGDKDIVRIEFNLAYDKIVAVDEPKKIVVSSFILPLVSAHLLVYSFEDIVARKINALYTREDGKDVFDLFHALDLSYNKEMLGKALGLIGYKNIEKLKEELKNKLNLFEKRIFYIGNSTNPYIPVSLRPEWRSFIASLMSKIDRI